MKKQKNMIRGAVWAALFGLVGMGLIWSAVVSVGEMQRHIKTELQVEGLINAINQLNDYINAAHKDREDMRKLMEMYGIMKLTK